MKVMFEGGLDQLIKHIKTALNGKEASFSKNSGFNKTKTDSVENDTNKLFTAKGAYDLKNTITTAYTSLVNTTKSALETSINTKLSHGGYSGTAQSLKTDIDSKLPNPGFGGVHELGRYLDLHLSGSTADYDARIFVDSDKTVSMTNSNGTFEFGPKNTTHCHLYTDRASFYFNKELMINGNRVYHEGFKPNKTDVGLNLVDNTADSAKNVLSATKLTTARAINGTNFDGTTEITTSNWGTSRTITIGNTGKLVNGSENVAWSATELGLDVKLDKGNYIGTAETLKSEIDTKLNKNDLPTLPSDIMRTGNYDGTGEDLKNEIDVLEEKISGSAEDLVTQDNAIWGGLYGGYIQDNSQKVVGQRYIDQIDGKAYICKVPSQINSIENYTPCNVVDNTNKLDGLQLNGWKIHVEWMVD